MKKQRTEKIKTISGKMRKKKIFKEKLKKTGSNWKKREKSKIIKTKNTTIQIRL